jgi:zinc protease
VRQISLPGGGTLVLQPDATLPYTALSMAWPGGDGLLSANEQGLGALTASLLARGTKTRSANQVEDFLADRAASFAASTSSETFSLGAKFPSRFTTDMLGLVRETLTSPALAEAELARAKEDQQNAIKRGEDQPIGLAFRKLPGLLFTSAPHAYLRLGDPAQVAGFTRSQAEAFWKRQATQPFVLSVCGQFDEAQMTAFATALARELNPQGATPAQAQAPQWKPKAKATLHLPERNQSHLFVIFKAPGRADQAMSARLQVLRAALAGQSGLLFRDMRDKQGLGYTVTAFLSQYKEAGFMAFYIGSDPDKLPQAMEGFRKAAADLAAKPLPQAELTRAKNILSGDYYQDRQSLMSRSREAAGALVQGFEREAELKLVEASQALTAEDVRQAAAAVLKWDEAFVLEVTP